MDEITKLSESSNTMHNDASSELSTESVDFALQTESVQEPSSSKIVTTTSSEDIPIVDTSLTENANLESPLTDDIAKNETTESKPVVPVPEVLNNENEQSPISNNDGTTADNIPNENAIDETVDNNPPLSPLEEVNAQLADLLPPDTEKKERYITENTDDSQELADEIGISGVFDEYNREILEPVFENRLRMSINSIKLAYSKIKNTVLSYKGMSQKYEGDHELYKKENKLLFRVEIGADCLILYLKLEKELDKNEYFHTIVDNSVYHLTPIKFSIKKGADNVSYTPLGKVLEVIGFVMEENEISPRNVYVPIAYAERYPVNPEAVLRGQESVVPIDGKYDSEEYDPIEGELTLNIVKELLGENFDVDNKKGKTKLEAIRQQATTIKSAVALTEPIVYFYENALNRDNTNAYLSVEQVLNDKFLGKLLPQQYFAIAENSDRIEQLNLYALKEIVTVCNENPKQSFALRISCRLLAKKPIFTKLLKNCETENKNLILAFDAGMLEALAKVGMDGINALRDIGVKIMIDGTENVGLHMLTDYAIDYLRFDSRYYTEDNPRRVALLDMMTGYANVQGILTTSCYVNTVKEAKFLLTHGINIIQGFAIGEPKRIVHVALKEFKKLPQV